MSSQVDYDQDADGVCVEYGQESYDHETGTYKILDLNSFSTLPLKLHPIVCELRGMGYDVYADSISISMAVETIASLSSAEREQYRLLGMEKRERDNVWTETAEWELQDPQASKVMRSHLARECIVHQVPPFVVQDIQKRWVASEFTCVTKEHVVIGDIVVPRKETILKEHPERQPRGNISKASLHYYLDLTYSALEVLRRSPNELQYRAKLNGERFIKTQIGKEWVLSGFKDIPISYEFPAEVVEYYGGKWSIIFPPSKASFTYREVRYHAHPFVPFLDLPTSKTHQFEGIMVYDGNMEYRCKFEPTVEIKTDIVWEISCANPPRFIRPRPGKIPMSDYAAFFLDLVPVSALYPSLKWREDEERQYLTRKSGAKLLLFTRTGVLLFKDLLKPLDLIGGQIEGTETALAALSREYQEETHDILDVTKIFKVGVSIDSSESVEWSSHVYLGFVPEIPKVTKPGSYFQEFADIGNCVTQRWVRRHISYVVSVLGERNLWYSQAVVRGGVLEECPYDPSKILTMSDLYATLLVNQIDFPCPSIRLTRLITKSLYPCSMRAVVKVLGLELKDDEYSYRVPTDTSLCQKVYLYLSSRRTKAQVYKEFSKISQQVLQDLISPFRVGMSVYYHRKN